MVTTMKVKVKDKEYELEEKDAALVTSILELTKQIKRMADNR